MNSPQTPIFSNFVLQNCENRSIIIFPETWYNFVVHSSARAMCTFCQKALLLSIFSPKFIAFTAHCCYYIHFCDLLLIINVSKNEYSWWIFESTVGIARKCVIILYGHFHILYIRIQRVPRFPWCWCFLNDVPVESFFIGQKCHFTSKPS